MTTGVIFPAFASEFKGSEQQILLVYGDEFQTLLKEASDKSGIVLYDFDLQKNNFLHDELKLQYISYIFSCLVADVITKKGLNPTLISGYSMGIYSAMYYCGSVTFYEGLLLIKHAWDTISEITRGSEFGMGMIIGLDENDLEVFINKFGGAEICNRNNPYTYIISGYRSAIGRILEAAANEGAMRTSVLPVSQPYHSQWLKPAEPVFEERIADICFKKPLYRYISSLDQRSIIGAEDLKTEVVSNLSSRMNWYATMKMLIESGSRIVFECGIGDGLTRNARFIEGDFKALPVAGIESLFMP